LGRQLLGLEGEQVELVALGVGERGPADPGELDLIERLGAQAGQPPGLFRVVLGEQVKVEPVLDRLGLGDLVEEQLGAAPGRTGNSSLPWC